MKFLATLCAGLVLILTHQESPEVEPVAFLSGTGNGAPFCHGIVLGDNIVTARHCIESAPQGQALYLRVRGKTLPLSAADLKRIYRGAFSSKSASFASDFNVFSLTGSEKPTAVPDLASRVSQARPTEMVTILGENGPLAQCVVRAVCGSNFFYECDKRTLPGWSGSPLVERKRPARVVGIHTAEGVPLSKVMLRQGTTIQAVIGRSSSLFPNSDQFGDQVARNRKFIADASPLCGSVDPPVSAGSTLTVTNLSTGRFIHALALADPATLIAIDITEGATALCYSRYNASWGKLSCSRNRYRFADRANALEHLGGNEFAIAESTLDPQVGMSAINRDLAAGGVTFAQIRTSPSGVTMLVSRRVISPLGSVYATKLVGDDLFVGGENGLCIITAGSTTCDKVCNNEKCDSGSDWRVNGILALTPTSAVAVGRDYVDETATAIPMVKWYEKRVDGWKQVRGIPPLSDLIALASTVSNRTAGMQFKAPVRIGSTIVAFGSDGGAYEIARSKTPRKIPIGNLWHDPQRPESSAGELEDAVRDAVNLPSGYIATASSDGAVHMLWPELRNGELVSLRGDQLLTVFDQGIWTTQVIAAGENVLVRTQDGRVTVVGVKAIPKPRKAGY